LLEKMKCVYIRLLCGFSRPSWSMVPRERVCQPHGSG